jgi:hypothetical protein
MVPYTWHGKMKFGTSNIRNKLHRPRIEKRLKGKGSTYSVLSLSFSHGISSSFAALIRSGLLKEGNILTFRHKYRTTGILVEKDVIVGIVRMYLRGCELKMTSRSLKLIRRLATFDFSHRPVLIVTSHRQLFTPQLQSILPPMLNYLERFVKSSPRTHFN